MPKARLLVSLIGYKEFSKAGETNSGREKNKYKSAELETTIEQI